MFDLFYIRHFLNGLVVAGAQPVHKLIFLATGLNADNDLIALSHSWTYLGIISTGSWKSATISITQSPVTWSMP